MLYPLDRNFAANQQKWVMSIFSVEVEISTNTLEALNRRKVYLTRQLKKMQTGIETYFERVDEHPNAWVSFANKIKSVADRAPELAQCLEETSEAIDFVKSFLENYPAE